MIIQRRQIKTNKIQKSGRFNNTKSKVLSEYKSFAKRTSKNIWG